MQNQSCVFYFCNYIDEEERDGCFGLIVFPMSCDCVLRLFLV